MIPPHVRAAFIVSDDVPALRAFYERLGWRSSAPADAAFVPFDLQGTALILWSAEEAAAELGATTPPFALLVAGEDPDEVDAAIEQVRANGARVVAEPAERAFGGRSGWFRDPIGTPWEVAWIADGLFPEPAPPAADSLVPRLNAITLVTDDVLGLRGFYEALGWPCRSDQQEDIAMFQLATGVLSNWIESEAETEIAQPLAAHGHRFRGVTLAMAVESAERVDAEFASAQQTGATVVAEPETRVWGGRSGYFADPQGTAWEIVWIPGASLSERGELQL